LKAYLEKWTPKSNDPLSAKLVAEYAHVHGQLLLKSFFGVKATRDNDFGMTGFRRSTMTRITPG
jgi:hypothetical protein